MHQTIQLDYLKDDLLVICDCTNLPGLSRDELFMSSRDRLRENLTKKTLEEELELMLRNHAGLQEANKQRELEASRDSLEDNKLLEKIIDNMLSFTPSLANFFSVGERLTSPDLNGGQDLSFSGKKYPTYFKIFREPESGLVKECAVNAKCAVTYETDVENQYFARSDDPGQLVVNPSKAKLGMLLWNGRGILFTKIPEGIEEGNRVQVTVEVSDSENQIPFRSKFDLKATQPIVKPKTHREKAQEKKSTQLDLPKIKKVTKTIGPITDLTTAAA